MKKFLAGALLAITALSMLAQADARSLGGGRSFGRQSQNVSRSAPAPAPLAPRPAATPGAGTPAPAMAPRPASPWRGILGGALLGLGLGALMSHFGMGSMFGSILMIALLVLAAMLIIRMFRSKTGTAGGAPFSSYGANNRLSTLSGNVPEGGSRLAPQDYQPLLPASGAVLDQPPAAPAPWGVPADFDSAAFLRHAKSNFIRMQAAWDKADVNDIREFTTPEVYGELKMQIQERGATPEFTDVQSIDAELLGIETVGDDYLASVKFKGMITAAPGAAAEPFAEVWNMSKPVSGTGGWVLAGIQQLS